MPAFQDRMIHVHSVPTLLMALLVVPSIARAQSITVCPDGSCDFTQLQSAIDSIPAGGSGEILVSAGTYDQGGITFGGIEVTIIGVDGAEDTILTQSGSEQVMLIDSGSVVALKGLTIRDGIASETEYRPIIKIQITNMRLALSSGHTPLHASSSRRFTH